MTDPWAAAQATQQNSSTQAVQNSGQQSTAQNSSGIVADENDPFATTSEFAGSGGGAFDPRVPFDDIEGRACIMIPRSFDPAANDPFNPGKTREEYRVDLVVLNGEPFSFEYNDRAKDADGNFMRDASGAYVKEKATKTVDTFPATFRLQSVAQGALIKPLKGVDAKGAFLLGVLKRTPQARDAGFTIESIEKSRHEWMERIRATGRPGADPQRSTWSLVDRAPYFTPEHRQLALKWWNEEKARRASA